MTLNEMDTWLRSFLNIENYSSDPSQNGIQVQNARPDKDIIVKAAFAVDASLASIEKAAEYGAQVLIVHHGIFWKSEQRLTGAHYRRAAALIQNNLALYACHIPLDANEFIGNNYGLARRLKLEQLEPFGRWQNMNIGVKGILPQPLSLDEIASFLFPRGEKPLAVLPFGKKEIRSIAIISGGAGKELEQAIEAKADVYITGEISHEQYHTALENNIHLIAGGHYQTETVGLSLLAEKLKLEQKIKTIFIDMPTGL